MSTPAIAIPDIGSSCDLTLFVACYNEEVGIIGTLETVLSALHTLPITYDIVVVDDASRDKSVELVNAFIAAHPQEPIKLIVNDVNMGLGTNFVEAAFHGRGEYYRMVCGDDVEPEEALISVFKHLGEAELILNYHAYRKFRGVHRRIISSLYTGTVNTLSGFKIRYYNGLPIYRRYDVIRWHPNSHGFGFQADLVTRLLDLGADYIEVPIIPREREGGSSKAFTFPNICSVAHSLLDILIRRVARIMYAERFTRPIARRRQQAGRTNGVAQRIREYSSAGGPRG